MFQYRGGHRVERHTQVNDAHVNGPTVGQPDGTKAKRTKTPHWKG